MKNFSDVKFKEWQSSVHSFVLVEMRRNVPQNRINDKKRNRRGKILEFPFWTEALFLLLLLLYLANVLVNSNFVFFY